MASELVLTSRASHRNMIGNIMQSYRFARAAVAGMLLLLMLACSQLPPQADAIEESVAETPAAEEHSNGESQSNEDKQSNKSTPEELAGTLIGSISIANKNIFDLDNPKENRLLYRLANKLHAKTRSHVITQQLLFAPGDTYSLQALQESERILRSNRYIRDAQIEAVLRPDGYSDVTVTTTDVWTLVPRLSYSHSGGESRSSLGIRDSNLLGSGITLEAIHRSDVDRDSDILKFVDRHVGDSWYGIKVLYEDSDDGEHRSIDFGKPFYSLESTRAHGILAGDYARVESVYDRGNVASQFHQESKAYSFYAGWSEGLKDGWAKRYFVGLAYDEQRFSEALDDGYPTIVMPGDRKLTFPYFGVNFVQDKFEESKNFDQIARTEDRFLGTAFNLRVGIAGASLGSDRNAVLLSGGARTSISRSKADSILLSSYLTTRLENGGARNFMLSMDAKYYHRQSEKRLLFIRLNGIYGHELDLDNQVLLGGDNGLRGYPLRYQSGDKSALLTIEQRFFTDWYPFRLFRVGAAMFFDVGRTWGEGPLKTGNDGMLKDIGVGLRLGNSRSGLGRMIHADIAYPLDGDSSISNVQFIVELKQSF